MCRLALAEEHIDATSFTIIRLFSGTLILLILLYFSPSKEKHAPAPSWSGAWALFIYASGFSYAYVVLDTGVGALILFTAVQITMISYALIKGERLSVFEWTGTALAFYGFVFLISPNVTSPNITGVFMMAFAGIAWGIYSVKGAGSKFPIQSTGSNFAKASLLSLLLLPILLFDFKLESIGAGYAALSGALTSALGYVLWYRVLPFLPSSTAAVSQLSVPVFAAFGGWILLAEIPSERFRIASVLILSGILIVIMSKRRKVAMSPPLN